MQEIFCVDPNILTMSDCEGAGEMFKVSPQMFKEEVVGLTVSSQLPLEAIAVGLKHVYTCQKSFRAEKSDTSKHLAEFLHIEYESYFINFTELIDFTENLVKYCIIEMLKKCSEEYKFLESPLSSKEFTGITEFLNTIVQKPFVKIKHKEAVDIIRNDVYKKIIKMKVLPHYESDLESEHEKYLVDKFGTFVFVTHWPLKIKSFYMKQCDNSNECESFDLLAPKVGEMFGGSMREHRYNNLKNEMEKRSMKLDTLRWYLDLRLNGSAPHAWWVGVRF